MSSTNRDDVAKMSQDQYFTPLKSFNPLLPYLPKDKKIWEPSCGDGRLVKRMIEYGLDASGDDLNNGYDFLLDDTKRECLVGNPPYSICKAFLSHCLEVSNEVYMLVRLNFLGSKERREWFRKNSPSALFVLSERPNFVRSIKCKEKKVDLDGNICGFKKLIPIESPRPKSCPRCGGKITCGTSDSTEYCYIYYGNTHKGLFWL